MVDAVVDAVDNLEVLMVAVWLLLRRDALDALAAGLVLLDVVLAVVCKALLLQRELDINGVGHIRIRVTILSIHNHAKRTNYRP